MKLTYDIPNILVDNTKIQQYSELIDKASSSLEQADTILVSDGAGNFDIKTVSSLTSSLIHEVSATTPLDVDLTDPIRPVVYLSGSIPLTKGGTGLTTLLSAGSFLYSDGISYKAGTITAGPGIVINAESAGVSISSSLETGYVAANEVYAGPTVGAASNPAFRTLVNADIPSVLSGKTVTGSFSGNGASITHLNIGAGSNLTKTTTNNIVTMSLNPNINITSITASTAEFLGDVRILGTASITQLNTINETQLQIGDKYIVLLTGSVDHDGLNGAGVLWGSGSTSGGTTGSLGEHAHILYRQNIDGLEIYPGLSSSFVSASSFIGDGSQLTGITSAQIGGLTGTITGSITGSQNITISNGTASLNNDISLTTVSASYFTGSFVGDGSQITNLDTSVLHLIYVSEDGNDSNIGSFTDPFKTIQAAINYATSSYSNYSDKVQIEILPGNYTGFTLSRQNTYFKSSSARAEQRIVKVDGSVVVDCATSADKFNNVVGFEGIFFNGNSSASTPTVQLSGAGAYTTYFKHCYLTQDSTNSAANIIKLNNTLTYAANKIVLQNCVFNGQKAGADLFNIGGGDVKVDSCEMYYGSAAANGSGKAIKQTGDSVVIADRLLIDIPTTDYGIYVDSTYLLVPPYTYASIPSCYITNSSIRVNGAGAPGQIYTTRVVLLSNILFSDTSPAIQGDGGLFTAVTYTSLNCVLNNITFTNTTASPAREMHGAITAPSFTGSFSGSVTYAQDSDKLDGYHASRFATTGSNTFIGTQTFDLENNGISPFAWANAGNAAAIDFSIFPYVSGTFSGSFAGNLLGTSSYADSATSASYSINSLSASYALTSSYSLQSLSSSYSDSGSYALSSSYSLNAITASYITSSNVVGSIPVSQGGTGLSSFISGALYIAHSTTSLTPLTGSDFQLIAWNGSSWSPYEQPYDLAGDVIGSFTSGSTIFNFKTPRNLTVKDIVSGSASIQIKVYITGSELTLPGVYNASIGDLITAKPDTSGSEAYFTIAASLR
jgi:hypothetical protein